MQFSACARGPSALLRSPGGAQPPAGTAAAIDERFHTSTSKGSGEGGSYTGAFPGFPSVSADFHQPPLRALSIPGAWVLRSPDLVVVSSFRMHCTFPIWTYRWCVAFNFDPRVLGIQPCHPSGSKPAAHFFRTEVRTRDLQVAKKIKGTRKENKQNRYGRPGGQDP